MTSASLCRKAAYLDSVDLDQARSHRVAEPIAVVVLVSVIWWCAYGRTTPFPSIWRVIPKDDQVGWLFAASALVAVALVAIVAIVPDRRWVGLVGAATWFVLSIWSTRRGDSDGLWALVIPLYLVVALAIVGLTAMGRALALKLRSRASDFWP
jgi:hypothetical protein